MAANAVIEAVGKSAIDLKDVQLLVAATSQGDFPLPGFASMVHGGLKMPPSEIAALHGIYATSVVGLRHATLAVRTGEVSTAVAVASEFASRLLKASRCYTTQGFGDFECSSGSDWHGT